MDSTKKHKPRISMSFITEWGGKDFAILTWEPGGRPALVIQAGLALDEARRDRCQGALTALLRELGFPEPELKSVRPGPIGPE